MPPVTPRRMCLPCMERLSHRAPRAGQGRANSAKSPQTGRFLPLAAHAAVSLDCAGSPLERTVMTIRHWPSVERPREKLLERGAHALSDAELLALLLGSGTRGRSAVELARALIAGFGFLRRVLHTQAARCLDRAGIGPARYAVLKAAVELTRRHF